MSGRELTFKYPNAVVRVHIPDYDETEHNRAMKELKLSAEKIMKEVLKNEYSARNTNVN